MSVEKHNPRHVAVILDGNRRFAKKLMLEPWKGHEFGQKKVEELLEWCKDLGITELTLYVFSMQNFNRPKEEFDYLMELFKKSFEKFSVDKRIKENGIRVNILGRYELFPKDLVTMLKNIIKKTKNNNKFILNFAMAYGGREEIIDAVKNIITKNLKQEDLTEEIISQNLYSKSEPDIIIRTGGEKRTSNFLPWQAAYSEWFFIDKTWPEFEKEDLIRILEEYKQRERRFGR